MDFAKLILGADTRQLRTAVADLDRLGAAAGRAEGGAGKASRSFAAMGRAAAIAGAAVAAAGALLLTRFVSATVEAEKVQAQLAAAIRSTGGAAGQSIEDLNANAKALQAITAYGDEAIGAMQGILLTFTNIRGDEFDAATAAVLNLATAMGTDLNSAALQVGKALNAPIEGMSALGRAGVQFTEEQKAAVAAMVATNDIAGAQAVILAELERQFGGSAVAARDTLGGALAALGNAWGDLFEVSGPAAENLRAAFERMVSAITSPGFVAAIQAIGIALFNLASVAIAAVSIGVDGLVAALSILRTAIDMPERLFRWMLDLGPTSLQAQRAVDQLTLAMGDEITQIAVLSGSMSGGIEMTRSMAEYKLGEAETRLANVDAMRIEALELIKQTAAYRRVSEDILLIEQQLATIASEQNRLGGGEFAPQIYRTDIEAALQLLGEAVAAQRELVAEAGRLSPEYQAQAENIERIRAAIAAATGGTVVFAGEAVTAADIVARLAQDTGEGADAARDLALAAGQISFAGAASSAAGLAAQLGVSLGLARALAGIGANTGGDSVVFDPRDPRFDAVAAARARTAITMQSVSDTAGSVSPFDPARMERGLVGGGGGGGGQVRDLADEYQNLLETLDPAVRAATAFREAQELINEALAGGAIGAEQASYALGLAQERYDDATDSANKFADATHKGADAMGELFGSILEGSKSAKEALIGLLKQIASVQLQNAFTGFANAGAGGGIFGFLGNLLTPIGANANGTDNWRGGLTMVGERGRELVNLPRGSQISSNMDTERMMGGSGAVEVRVIGGDLTLSDSGAIMARVRVVANTAAARGAQDAFSQLGRTKAGWA